MYRRISRIAALIAAALLLAASLTACSRPEAESVPVTRYSAEGKTTALVPDPEATGELTVDFMWNYFNDAAQKAKEMYEDLYPNVEVTVVEHTEAEFNGGPESWAQNITAFQTEIMAGRGPDVFLASSEAVDLYKTMKAGAYADMTSYFADDPNFNISDFNEAAFYGGQYEGKQYLVPVSYKLPLIVTTDKILEETGFSIKNCKDYFSTGDEIVRTLSKLEESDPTFESGIVFNLLRVPYLWMDWADILKLDYPNAVVQFPEDEARHVYEQLQQLSPYLFDQKDSTQPFSSAYLFERFLSRDILFAEEQELRDELKYQFPALLGAGETPVIFPYRNVNGNITAMLRYVIAVNQNCKNKENAYRFVKLLMSPEYACYEDDSYDNYMFLNDLPISKQALSSKLEAAGQMPNAGTAQEGWIFINGEPYPAKPVPEEFIEQLLQYAEEVDTVNIEPPINITILQAMLPCLWGDASFEKCYSEAKNAADIYISE